LIRNKIGNDYLTTSNEQEKVFAGVYHFKHYTSFLINGASKIIFHPGGEGENLNIKNIFHPI